MLQLVVRPAERCQILNRIFAAPQNRHNVVKVDPARALAPSSQTIPIRAPPLVPNPGLVLKPAGQGTAQSRLFRQIN